MAGLSVGDELKVIWDSPESNGPSTTPVPDITDRLEGPLTSFNMSTSNNDSDDADKGGSKGGDVRRQRALGAISTGDGWEGREAEEEGLEHGVVPGWLSERHREREGDSLVEQLSWQESCDEEELADGAWAFTQFSGERGTASSSWWETVAAFGVETGEEAEAERAGVARWRLVPKEGESPGDEYAYTNAYRRSLGGEGKEEMATPVAASGRSEAGIMKDMVIGPVVEEGEESDGSGDGDGDDEDAVLSYFPAMVVPAVAVVAPGQSFGPVEWEPLRNTGSNFKPGCMFLLTLQVILLT